MGASHYNIIDATGNGQKRTDFMAAQLSHYRQWFAIAKYCPESSPSGFV
ncbi:hypothetical protein IMCC9480_2007 [Oxalobacteraceae bacterium IMCC9480]|nr:hypothetical protein IMCC9480_2007 [Oxalobacteraceae bacterium IMCC9480]